MSFYNLCFSPTGSTQRVANILAKNFEIYNWGDKDRSSNYLSDVDSISNDDLVLIGTPCFAGRVPEYAAEKISKIDGKGAACVLLVTYGNRDYDDSLLELRDLAIASNFKPVAAVAAICRHSIVPEIAADRPNNEDKVMLEIFAKQIIEKLQNDDYSIVECPGNSPYKEYKPLNLVPEVNSNCILCGVCAKSCPTGAIPVKAPDTTSVDKCITCMRCISVCPMDARNLDSEKTGKIKERLEKNCSEPKQAQLFL